MPVVILSDWSDVEKELDRLSVMPSPKATALLSSVLAHGFALTQAAVHVQTGSLKSSAKMNEDISYQDSKWEGSVRYGGPSMGINNPVDYAIYEQRRGGPHDFMDPMKATHPLFVSAMEAVLRG